MPGGKHVLGMSKGNRIFGTAKVGDRGQIVIPKEACRFLKLDTKTMERGKNGCETNFRA